MKKILIGILTIMLIALLYITVANGLSLADFEMRSVQSIKDANQELSTKIEAGNKITKQTYRQGLETLQSSIQSLTKVKNDYNSKTHYAEGEEPVGTETRIYNMETLYVWLGDYSQEYKLRIKFDLAEGAVSGTNNINFIVEGDYRDITEFIAKLENDERLNFKIEDFTMVRGGGSVSSPVPVAEVVPPTNQDGTNATGTEGQTATTPTADSTATTTGGSDTKSLTATFKVTNINVNLDDAPASSQPETEAPASETRPTGAEPTDTEQKGGANND